MLQPGGTMLVLLVASHDVFDVFNQLSQNPRYAPYIPVNIFLFVYLTKKITIICNYKLLIIIFMFTKDKSRLVSPFQYSTEPQRQLKRMVKDVGFHVIHCSLREKTYFHVDSHTFLRKYINNIITNAHEKLHLISSHYNLYYIFSFHAHPSFISSSF